MQTEFPTCVRVVFNEYTNELPYAVSLAEELGTALHVQIPTTDVDILLAALPLEIAPGELRKRTLSNVEELVRARFGTSLDPEKLIVSLGDASVGLVSHECIVVSHTKPPSLGEHVLDPARELAVGMRSKGPILIPLGDGASSLVAADYGLAIARRLHTHALFWHTTWQNESVHSVDPRMHVCAAAQTVIDKAEAMGRAHDTIRERCQIECAETIVEGLVHAALISDAALIVMARGTKKIFGSYPDRVRARNCPVPLLIIEKGTL